LNTATSKVGIKHKTLSKSVKLNIVNKGDGIANVPCFQTAGELGIPLRKVADKMLGMSDTGESVLRLQQVTQIQHTCVLSS
jgi:hypothetical protein